MYFFKDDFEFVTIDYEDYYKLLHSIKNFYDEIGLEDSLGIFIMYTYMLWNGYFSIDRKYQFNYNRKITEKCYGAGIMLGVGTCVENSYMLNDIYQMLKYDSIIIHNKIKKLKINEELIERKIIKSDNNIKKNKFNHLSVLVNDANYNFIYDPTNLTCFNLKKSTKALGINNKGIMNIDLNTDFYFYYEKYHLERILSKINYDKKNNKDEIIFRIYKLLEFCKNNEKYLELFYSDNKEKIKNIVKEKKAR